MALVDCTILVEPSQVAISLASAPTVQVAPVTANIVVEGLAGIRGPQGLPGIATSTDQYEAGQALSGHRAVRIRGGLAYYCDAAQTSDAGKAIGITVGAVLQGGLATVQTLGKLTEPSWNWNEGPVFVGPNGVLTQSTAGQAFTQQVGVAVSATSIDINPQLAIIH